ncbi:MAG: hypothetical protein ABSH24_36515 [Bryobacteraceae bacterium]
MQLTLLDLMIRKEGEAVPTPPRNSKVRMCAAIQSAKPCVAVGVT